MTFTSRKKYNPDNNGALAYLLDLGQWKSGIINRDNEYSLRKDGLLDALNVDINNNGSISTRNGYIKVIDGDCHSMYTFKNKIYFVKNGDLCRATNENNIETLQANFSSYKVNYIEVADELYIATKDKTKRINRYENMDLWGTQSPRIQSNVLVGEQGSGSFKKGIYRLNYSYLYGNYESGIYPLDLIIDVPYDDFNLVCECFPSAFSTDALFYISSQNGSELYLAKQGYEVEIDYLDKITKSPKTNSEEIPAWENLTFANGRIYGSVGSNIYFSNDRDYRQHNPVMFIGIDNTNIDLLYAFDTGLIIGTQLGIYFLQLSNPEKITETQLIKLAEDKVVIGTVVKFNDKTIGFLTDNGYIVADASGKIENKSKEKIDLSKNYSYGSSLYRKINGKEQVIFSLNSNGEKSSMQTYTKNNIT